MENGLKVNKEVGGRARKVSHRSSLGIIVTWFVLVVLVMEAYDSFVEMLTLEVASTGPGDGSIGGRMEKTEMGVILLF